MNELPDDVRALLDAAEAGAPPPPAGLEAAVLAKVTATVAAPAAVGLASLPFAAALGKPLAAVALAVGLGGAGLVVVNQNRAPSVLAPALPNVPSAPPSQAGTPAPPVERAAVDLEVAPTLPSVPVPVPVPGLERDAPVRDTETDALPSVHNESAPAPRETVDANRTKRRALEDERASESKLLEEAREALARGDGDRALAQLQEQARLFPRGRLQEERRALTVVAFATRGDRVRARAAARAFEREHPSSLFLEMVRAAVVDEAAP